MNVEQFYLNAAYPDISEVEIWTLPKMLAEVEPGDQDWSWRSQFAWLNQNSADKLKALHEDISENGVQKPLLVGPDMRLWDGHHRLLVMYWRLYRYVPVELVPKEIPV